MNSSIINVPSLLHVIQHATHHLLLLFEFLLVLCILEVLFYCLLVHIDNFRLFSELLHEVSILYWNGKLDVVYISHCLNHVCFFIEIDDLESSVKGLKDDLPIELRSFICVLLQNDLRTNAVFVVLVLVTWEIDCK